MLCVPKDPKIRKFKFLFPWIGPFHVKKTFGNNIIQLSTLNNKYVAQINVNKLKAYQNPIELIITVVAITISINKLENTLPKQYKEMPIFGDEWKQLTKPYEGLNSNKKIQNDIA